MVEGLGFSSCFGGLSLRVFDHPSMGFTTSPLGFGGKSLRFRVGCFFGWGSATLDKIGTGYNFRTSVLVCSCYWWAGVD